MTTTFRRFLAVSAVVALCCSASLVSAEPVQMLKNSGFQNGTEGWEIKGAVQFTTETGPDGGIIVTLSGGPQDNELKAAPVAVTPKKNYLFAMWARSVTTGQGGATIRFLDKDQKPIAGADQQTGVGDEEDDWKNVEMNFNAPANAAFAVLIINGGASGQGRFEISNPKMYENTPDM